MAKLLTQLVDENTGYLARRLNTNGTKLACNECGHKFTKSKLGHEVKCPKCKGYDVDLAPATAKVTTESHDINYDNMSHAWHGGHTAYWDNGKHSDNPHEHGSKEHKEWKRGFAHGKEMDFGPPKNEETIHEGVSGRDRPPLNYDEAMKDRKESRDKAKHFAEYAHHHTKAHAPDADIAHHSYMAGMHYGAMDAKYGTDVANAMTTHADYQHHAHEMDHDVDDAEEAKRDRMKSRAFAARLRVKHGVDEDTYQKHKEEMGTYR